MAGRAVRLLICAAMLAVLPIAFVRSLRDGKAPQLAAGGGPPGVRREPMPHLRVAAVAAPVVRRAPVIRVPARKPRHRGHAVLVTYTPPVHHWAPPRAAVRPAPLRRTQPAKATPKPTPKPKPTPRPKPRPAPPVSAPAPSPAPAPTPTPGATPAIVVPEPTPAPTVTPSTVALSTRPGHGYGDKNHIHTGPPGHP